jgi:translation initiation factor 5A
MMIKGRPCKVINISTSKTGKHGSAKCNFVATDIFNGKKLEDMQPSTAGVMVPIVTKNDWEITDIDEDGTLVLMDESGNQKVDLNLPTFPEGFGEEIRTAWAGGDNIIIVTVQAAVGEEAIIAWKKDEKAK